MRIFASVGTGLEPFDRFVTALDEAVGVAGIPVEGVCQTGTSRRKSAVLANRAFVTRSEFSHLAASADVLICHAGVGAIRTALAARKVPCVMPRLRRHGEVLNDHQLDVVRELETRGLVRPFADARELARLLTQHCAELRHGAPPPIQTGTIPACLRQAIRGDASPRGAGRFSRILLRGLASAAPPLRALRLMARPDTTPVPVRE